jgi:hypothetical protein
VSTQRSNDSFTPPWWVRVVAPLKSNCWACNIWRGIILGFTSGIFLTLIFNAVLIRLLRWMLG